MLGLISFHLPGGKCLHAGSRSSERNWKIDRKIHVELHQVLFNRLLEIGMRLLHLKGIRAAVWFWPFARLNAGNGHSLQFLSNGSPNFL